MLILLAMKLGFTSVDRHVSSTNNRYWSVYNPTLIQLVKYLRHTQQLTLKFTQLSATSF